MKLLMKLLMFIVLIAGLLLVGVLLTKDRIIRTRAIAEVEKVTGFPLEIDELKLGLFSSKFELKGCRLMNPYEFKAEEALVINELSADVKLLSLLTSTIKLKSVVVDIPKLSIETTKAGVNNFELLQKRIKDYVDARKASEKGEEDDPNDGKDKPKKDDKELFIDDLQIRLGKGSMVDYSRGEEAAAAELELNIDKRYTDVDDVNDVVIDLTATVLQRTIFGAIGDDLGGFIKNISEGGEKNGQDLKKEAEKLEEQFKGLLKQFR